MKDITDKQHKELLDVLQASVNEVLSGSAPPDDVYDIALDTYTSLLEDGIEYPFTVGVTRAKDRAKNFIRNREKRREIELSNPDMYADICPSANSAEDPSEVLEAEQRMDALANLTPVLRQALDDFYIEGLSIKEIAAKEGASTDAVKKRLQRAREAVTGE